ncbi:MAG: branched-chain amino acid ABC transporter permease [Acidimicrobiales bacterium]
MPQLVVDGLATGAIYALAALGFVLIFNATDTVNFAHGQYVMLGAYLGVFVTAGLGLGVVAALVIVPVAMMLAGGVFYLVALRPVLGKPFSSSFVSTIALGIIISQGALLVAGPDPLKEPPVRSGAAVLSGVVFTWQALLIVGVTAILVLVQRTVFARTLLGQQLRASAQDPTMASLLGISVNRMIMVSFALAGAFAGIAGVLIAPTFYVSPTLGQDIILKIYIAAIIGGFGSLGGAVIGGLGLGVLQDLISGYVSSTYADAVIFGILLFVLVLRPQGMFGELIAEKV